MNTKELIIGKEYSSIYGFNLVYFGVVNSGICKGLHEFDEVNGNGEGGLFTELDVNNFVFDVNSK